MSYLHRCLTYHDEFCMWCTAPLCTLLKVENLNLKKFKLKNIKLLYLHNRLSYPAWWNFAGWFTPPLCTLPKLKIGIFKNPRWLPAAILSNIKLLYLHVCLSYCNEILYSDARHHSALYQQLKIRIFRNLISRTAAITKNFKPSQRVLLQPFKISQWYFYGYTQHYSAPYKSFENLNF